MSASARPFSAVPCQYVYNFSAYSSHSVFTAGGTHWARVNTMSEEKLNESRQTQTVFDALNTLQYRSMWFLCAPTWLWICVDDMRTERRHSSRFRRRCCICDLIDVFVHSIMIFSMIFIWLKIFRNDSHQPASHADSDFRARNLLSLFSAVCLLQRIYFVSFFIAIKRSVYIWHKCSVHRVSLRYKLPRFRYIMLNKAHYLHL